MEEERARLRSPEMGRALSEMCIDSMIIEMVSAFSTHSDATNEDSASRRQIKKHVYKISLVTSTPSFRPPPLLLTLSAAIWGFILLYHTVIADVEVDVYVASGQPKRRLFRKFSFRGVDLDALLDMKNEELIKLFHDCAPRRFQRGVMLCRA